MALFSFVKQPERPLTTIRLASSSSSLKMQCYCAFQALVWLLWRAQDKRVTDRCQSFVTACQAAEEILPEYYCCYANIARGQPTWNIRPFILLFEKRSERSEPLDPNSQRNSFNDTCDLNLEIANWNFWAKRVYWAKGVIWAKGVSRAKRVSWAKQVIWVKWVSWAKLVSWAKRVSWVKWVSLAKRVS